jgi:hypothetical protein
VLYHCGGPALALAAHTRVQGSTLNDVLVHARSVSAALMAYAGQAPHAALEEVFLDHGRPAGALFADGTVLELPGAVADVEAAVDHLLAYHPDRDLEGEQDGPTGAGWEGRDRAAGAGPAPGGLQGRAARRAQAREPAVAGRFGAWGLNTGRVQGLVKDWRMGRIP